MGVPKRVEFFQYFLVLFLLIYIEIPKRDDQSKEKAYWEVIVARKVLQLVIDTADIVNDCGYMS